MRLRSSSLEWATGTGEEKIGGEGRAGARIEPDDLLLVRPGPFLGIEDIDMKDAVGGVRAAAGVGRLLLPRDDIISGCRLFCLLH